MSVEFFRYEYWQGRARDWILHYEWDLARLNIPEATKAEMKIALRDLYRSSLNRPLRRPARLQDHPHIIVFGICAYLASPETFGRAIASHLEEHDLLNPKGLLRFVEYLSRLEKGVIADDLLARFKQIVSIHDKHLNQYRPLDWKATEA